MINENPHFKWRERPAYELGYLLRHIPADLDLTSDGGHSEKRLQLEAAKQHAENYHGTLLSGLESLGRVMFSAGENEDWPVDQNDVSRIGSLISQMAVQIQFLSEFSEFAADRISDVDKKGKRK